MLRLSVTAVGGQTAADIDFKVGNLHSLIVEQPPKLELRRFYAWNLNSTVEVFGGNSGRPFFVDVWINDSTFTSFKLLDDYLATLDGHAGKHGTFKIGDSGFTPSETLERPNSTFMGFERMPFRGQQRPEPLLAVGTHGLSYGSVHVSGRLHFYQLELA